MNEGRISIEFFNVILSQVPNDRLVDHIIPHVGNLLGLQTRKAENTTWFVVFSVFNWSLSFI